MRAFESPLLSTGSPRNQRGVTLLEVLISIVVLSVGLLGFAGLQTVSMKNNTSAYHRSQATFLAHDIVERMRANKPKQASYIVDFDSTGTYNDLTTWVERVQTELPGGQASVFVDNATGVATITLRWDDNRDGSAKIDFVTETVL